MTNDNKLSSLLYELSSKIDPMLYKIYEQQPYRKAKITLEFTIASVTIDFKI